MKMKATVAWISTVTHACIQLEFQDMQLSCMKLPCMQLARQDMHVQVWENQLVHNQNPSAPGAELKKMFLESGGNFDLVEIKVKQWTESKKTLTDTESRVTKRQLKEKYFWDDVKASG